MSKQNANNSTSATTTTVVPLSSAPGSPPSFPALSRFPAFPLCSPGIALLEVVLAMTLFFATAMIVAGAMNATVRAAQQVKLQAAASDHAVTVMSELQVGVREMTSQTATPLLEPFADWSAQISVEARNDVLGGPALDYVQVIITHAESGYTYRLVQLLPARALLEEEGL